MLEQRERRRFTQEEYLWLEDQSEGRSEFCDGEIFTMTGGSLRHNQIVCNLVAELSRALKGTGCRVYSSDVRLLDLDRLRGLVRYLLRAQLSLKRCTPGDLRQRVQQRSR